MVIHLIRAHPPDKLARFRHERGYGAVCAACLHDHLAVHEDGRSREAVIRLLGAELFDEMFGPDELAIQPVEGDEVAPRIQTKHEVSHD